MRVITARDYLGCVIDGSHWSSFDFAVAVIDFAVDRGFEIDETQYREDLEWLSTYDKGDFGDEDKYLDIVDSLDWTYEDALDYLNSTAPDNLIWFVEDQSLFLDTTED